MSLETKLCKICNKPFIPIVGNQIKCAACRDKKKPKKEAVGKVCKQCGKAFTTTIYNKEYCSKECREAHNYTPVVIKKKCGICGKSFETTTENRKYCSEDCSKIAFRRSVHKYTSKRYNKL